MAAGDPVKATDLSSLAVSSSTRPLVRLLQQVAQSIATTNTALTFSSGSEDIDTHGFHDVTTNNSRITPTIAGYYQVFGTYVTQSTAGQYFAITPGKSGAAIGAPRSQVWPVATAGIKTVSTSAILTADGVLDYFEMYALAINGPTLSQVTGGFTSVFECIYLRPL